MLKVKENPAEQLQKELETGIKQKFGGEAGEMLDTFNRIRDLRRVGEDDKPPGCTAYIGTKEEHKAALRKLAQAMTDTFSRNIVVDYKYQEPPKMPDTEASLRNKIMLVKNMQQ
jgi:hypothetical protein